VKYTENVRREEKMTSNINIDMRRERSYQKREGNVTISVKKSLSGCMK